MTIKKMTGTGGQTPVWDGTMRGVISAALLSLLQFVNDKSDWITDDDVITLTPLALIISFVCWGVWDKFIAPKL
jgi:NhaP-type Na+/H+ or K+/H+ antiporter